MLNKREWLVLIFMLAFAMVGGILNGKKKQAPASAPALVEKAFPVRADSAAGTSHTAVPASLKVSLNRATLPELLRLEGVGEVTARRIIEFRETRGAFKKVEDLMKIKGVGRKKFDRLLPLIEL